MDEGDRTAIHEVSNDIYLIYVSLIIVLEAEISFKLLLPTFIPVLDFNVIYIYS